MNSSELKSKLSKSLEFLSSELTQIRTGRASPSLIEDIKIDVYGTSMSLKEVGSIMVLDPQNLVVSPWDKNQIAAINKAIGDSGKGVNPVVESDRVRVPIPSLTEERRKEFVKIVSSRVEECKSSVRNIRQEAMKDIDKDFSSKLISEDEKFDQREETEKLVKEYVDKIEAAGDSKKEELMKV